MYQNQSKDRVSDICSKLIAMFGSGQFPAAVARTLISRQADDHKPCHNWSINNRLLMLAAGTNDARGYQQWQSVKRYVVKGAKALHILAPIIRTVRAQGTNQAEDKVIGFRAIPVFRFEDTEGTPLPAHDYTPPALPPLLDVAQKLGSVSYAPAADNSILGSCSLKGNIKLYSHDPDVFFHELAHQVHNTIVPLKPGQQANQEIVAELSSCILCELYGFSGYHWSGWNYIRSYAGGTPEEAMRVVSVLLQEVEAVVSKILELSTPAASDALNNKSVVGLQE